MNNFIKKIGSFFKSNSEITVPAAVLTVICIVVTLALSSTNLLTAKKIEALASENQNAAMSKLIKADEYRSENAEIDGENIEYSIAVRSGEIAGYIFTVNEKGYGDAVSVMTAVNNDGTVAAIEILDVSNETPGLGQNVKKEEFYGQYSGLSEGITAIRGGSADTDNNEINAVTGATISSKAVTNAVNKAISYAKQIIEKGDVS